MPGFSTQYVSNLLDEKTFNAAAALQSLIYRWDGVGDRFPDRRLPKPLFAALEVLAWFSQGGRSGAPDIL